MTDHFAKWVRVQEATLHANQTAFNAMFKLMGSGVTSDSAAQAAKDVGEAQTHAWEAWMAMWGAGR